MLSRNRASFSPAKERPQICWEGWLQGKLLCRSSFCVCQLLRLLHKTAQTATAPTKYERPSPTPITMGQPELPMIELTATQDKTVRPTVGPTVMRTDTTLRSEPASCSSELQRVRSHSASTGGLRKLFVTKLEIRRAWRAYSRILPSIKAARTGMMQTATRISHFELSFFASSKEFPFVSTNAIVPPTRMNFCHQRL